MKNEKQFIGAFNRLRKMSYKQFETWLTEFGRANYEHGIEYGNKEAVTWFEEDLKAELMLWGLGEELADLVIYILLSKESKEL